MSEKYNGSCMCGSVQFTWTGTPRFVKECVCDSCRRAHGASVVGWVGGPASQFNIDIGKSLLTWYRSSAESERGFCAECGTRILFRSSKWADEIHIALACIAKPHDLVSTGVSFEEELPSWTTILLGKANSGTDT